MPWTEEEKREYGRAYYQANKEKAKEYSRKYREVNQEYYKEYRIKNAETIKAKRKEYDERNKERIRELAKASAVKRFNENPDKIRQARRATKQRLKEKNPKKYLESVRNGVRKAGRKRCSEMNDSYVAYLLSVSSGSRLYPTDIPKELIEAKRLQLLIRRELDEKRK